MRPTQDQINKLASQGIKPGVTLQFLDHEFVVPETNLWHSFSSGDIAWLTEDGAPHGYCWLKNNTEEVKIKITKLVYYVRTFPTPTSNFSQKVNQEVDNVRSWAGHLGEVRLVSLSDTSTPVTYGITTLTISHYSYEYL